MITWVLAPAGPLIPEEILDPAFFVALYLGVVATVFALGEPISKLEIRVRAFTLVLCAVIAVIMVIWLSAGVLARLGLLG